MTVNKRRMLMDLSDLEIEKKKQSHVSVADKDMQVDKTQRGGVVHSENFL